MVLPEFGHTPQVVACVAEEGEARSYSCSCCSSAFGAGTEHWGSVVELVVADPSFVAGLAYFVGEFRRYGYQEGMQILREDLRFTRDILDFFLGSDESQDRDSFENRGDVADSRKGMLFPSREPFARKPFL